MRWQMLNIRFDTHTADLDKNAPVVVTVMNETGPLAIIDL